MPNPKSAPRPYRVRIFAPDGEILTNRAFITVLDLTPGAGSAHAKSELDRLLKTLAALDDPAMATAGHYLTVTDTHTDETFVWLAR